jgi:16S rRNA (guanine527-N7)-methyltransferase
MPEMEILARGAEKLGLRLSAKQLAQFQTYYQELLDWNRRMNLTRITDYEEVQMKHFLDSLTVILVWPQSSTAVRLIDVGTGAGLPGIPLKIIMPEIEVVLLDSTAKKAVFLSHMKDKLGLTDCEIVVGRAEEVAQQPGYREKFELVLSRAVAPLPVLAELALPFCAVGGAFVAQKKGDICQELKDAGGAIGKLGGSLRETRRVRLEEFSDERWLAVIDKVMSTPRKYPRRPGIPAKRPLKQNGYR